LYKDVLIIAPGPVHAVVLDRRAIVLRLEPFDQLLHFLGSRARHCQDRLRGLQVQFDKKLGAALLVSKPAKNRSGFIGSSVARIIMGTDEAALVRGEKSGVAVR
jgi:hypothetical protein